MSVYSLQFYSGHYEAAQVTPCRLIRGCLEFYSGTVMPHPPGHHRKDTPSSGLAHSWFQSSCLKVLFYISNSVKGQLFYQISQLLYPYPPPRPPSAARQQLLPAACCCSMYLVQLKFSRLSIILADRIVCNKVSVVAILSCVHFSDNGRKARKRKASQISTKDTIQRDEHNSNS